MRLEVCLKELSKYKNRHQPLDVKNLIESNLRVFKENMKIIIGSVLDQICAIETSSSKIEQLLIKENNKGTFEEIKEVDEFGSDCNSRHSSVRV